MKFHTVISYACQTISGSPDTLLTYLQSFMNVDDVRSTRDPRGHFQDPVSLPTRRDHELLRKDSEEWICCGRK
jgi:hypothetical protein